MSKKIILQYTEDQTRELLKRLVNLISVKMNYKQVILNCWNLLQVEPRQKSPWLSTRLRNEELIENQEELLLQLRETLEPIVNKINKEGDKEVLKMRTQSDDPDDYIGDESDIPTDTPDNGDNVNPDDIEPGSRIIGDDVDEVLDGEEN